MTDQLPPRRSKRHPPMPMVPEGGACRWCANVIVYPPGHKKAGEPNPRRRWCKVNETNCVRDHMVAHHQSHLRRALWRRDHGRCAECSVRCRRDEWDADHRIPLWKVPADVTMEQRAAYWGLQNAQTLCSSCHARKTAAEAKERATIRRARKASKIDASPAEPAEHNLAAVIGT